MSDDSIQELNAIVKTSEEVQIFVDFWTEETKETAQLWLVGGYYCVTKLDIDKKVIDRLSFRSLMDALSYVKMNYSDQKIDLTSFSVKMTSGSTTSAKTKPKAIAAYCVTFDKPIPSTSDLKALKKAKDSEANSLRKSIIAEAIKDNGKTFKELTKFEKAKVGNFRKSDLRGVDLDGMKIWELDFQGSNFEGASMKDAQIDSSDMKKCNCIKANMNSMSSGSTWSGSDFSGASLTSAHLSFNNLSNCVFVGADLTHARMYQANLKGADFSNAKMELVHLDQALYDHETVFPDGFVIPKGMRWKGKGPRPSN